MGAQEVRQTRLIHSRVVRSSSCSNNRVPQSPQKRCLANSLIANHNESGSTMRGGASMVLSEVGEEGIFVANKFRRNSCKSEGFGRAAECQSGGPFEGWSFQSSREESCVAFLEDGVA